MKKLSIIFILVFFAFTCLIAQERGGMNPEMYEKIKAEKISFFTAKMDLTPTEAQIFWPVYNEFEMKRFAIQQEIHEFEHMPDEKFASLSDAEVEKLTDNYVSSFEKEAQLLKDYNKRFQKILPKKKILTMYRTENEFRGHLIREFRKNQKRD